ncbi:MAG TPA: hypothetical protein VG123_28360 [Streptosporangiaceae bacterium]|nr:hypothetical protein [Streptosporangiaceae bacterium]
MQPVQLSLLPEEVPAPAWMMFPQLGEQDVAAAVTVLARLIAAAAASAGGDGDE